MVTNIDVRDELIRCFAAAHKEFMQKGAEGLGMDKSDEEIMNKTNALVKMAFREVNANFENPTKDEIMKVISVLQKKARTAGRDEEVIKKHSCDMISMLEKLD